MSGISVAADAPRRADAQRRPRRACRAALCRPAAGARYTLGETDLLTVIAAVIVGGTLLNGGKGSIVGALVGSLMMGMLNNGLILMGLSVSDQMIVRGLIILAAVALSLREKTR